jgi:hypothetical protein
MRAEVKVTLILFVVALVGAAIYFFYRPAPGSPVRQEAESELLAVIRKLNTETDRSKTDISVALTMFIPRNASLQDVRARLEEAGFQCGNRDASGKIVCSRPLEGGGLGTREARVILDVSGEQVQSFNAYIFARTS